MRRALITVVLLAACSTEPAAGAVRACRAPGRDQCPSSTGSFSDPLQHRGRANTHTFIETTDIVVDGSILYACTGVRGLSIFDAREAAPELLVEKVAPRGELADASFPRCQHVGLDSALSRVVITNRGDEIQPQSWLALFDVSDPSSPRELGTWFPPSGSIEGVALSGNRLYAAAHSAGVYVLDVADDGSMHQVANVDPPDGDAWQVALQDDRLLVADGPAGLRIYDVSARDMDPEPVGHVPLPGTSRDVIFEGDRAYVAASSHLAIVGLDDTPRALVEHPVEGTALALAMVEPGIVAVAEWDELRGYDVTDPTNVQQSFAEVVPTNDDFSRVLAIDADSRRVFAGEWTGLHQFVFFGGSGPEVALNPGALQFGTLAPGQDAQRVLVIRNDGDVPLTVHDVVSAEGVSVDQTCLSVAPRSAAAVEVSLSPTTTRPLQSAVRVCSDDPDEAEAEVSLSANIPGLGVGDPAPTFTLQDLGGRTWSNDDLRGKVAILAYFATF